MGSLVHVEVAWDTDPLTRPGASDWTRLGSVDSDLLVESLRTSRGADIRTGAVEAGEATAVINDPNGNLDPSNVRSAWGQRVVTDGVTTNTDATVTSASAVFSAFDVGKPITGTGIPASTTIASVTSATEIELSAVATASGTGVSLTIGTANVVPRRRIRFVVDPDADNLIWIGEGLEWVAEALAWGYDETALWTGFIRSLPIQWRKQVQWTTLTAAGIIWLLSEMSLPPSVLDVETRASGPVNYWPLTETAGRIAEDVVGLTDGAWRFAASGSTGSMIPYDTRPATVFANPQKGAATSQNVRISSFAFPQSFTLGLWFRWVKRATQIPIDIVFLFNRNHPLSAGYHPQLFVLRDTADGPGYVVAEAGGGSADTSASQIADVFDGLPHFVTLSIDDATTTGSLTIDGVTAGTWTTTTTTYMDAYPTEIGAGFWLTANLPYTHQELLEQEAQEWMVGHVAVWDRVLTLAEVSGLYEAGTNPWADDLTGARMGRILDLAGVDALDRDIDTGTQTCGPTLLGGQNYMEYIRKIAATEGGPIGEDAEGRLFLRERIANSPTVTATFSDDPVGDSGYPVSPLDPDFSLDRLVNYAEVTRENGVTQFAENAASRTKYGDKSVSLDTLHQSPSQARSAAARLTIRNAAPRLVFRQVEADSIDVANSVQLETDIGEAVDVIARPPRGGDPIDQTSIVERVEQDFDGMRWRTTFGVAEHTVLPLFWWDEPGQGWNESVWPDAV